MYDQFNVVIDFATDVDASEADAITRSLRLELLAIDVDDAVLGSRDGHEAGSKGTDLIGIGEIIVAAAPFMIRPIFSTIQQWLKNRPVRSVVVRIGGDSIEISDATRKERLAALEAFAKRVEVRSKK